AVRGRRLRGVSAWPLVPTGSFAATLPLLFFSRASELVVAVVVAGLVTSAVVGAAVVGAGAGSPAVVVVGVAAGVCADCAVVVSGLGALLYAARVPLSSTRETEAERIASRRSSSVVVAFELSSIASTD